MDSKKCFRCNTVKLLDEFNLNKKKKDGHQSNCKICSKAYLKEHYKNNKKYYLQKKIRYAKRNRVLINEYKAKIGCARCLETDSCCLEFHHINDDKENSISVLVGSGQSVTTIFKEIKKCIIVCRNCHSKIHRDQRKLANAPVSDTGDQKFDSSIPNQILE